MSWMLVSLNHRTRLALVAAGATGGVLTLLFASLLSLARENLYAQKRATLDSAMRSFTPAEDPRFDLEEFREAYPELSASVYDRSGKLLETAGRARPARIEGHVRVGESLQLGGPFKDEWVVLALDMTDTDRGLDQLRGILLLIWAPIILLVGGATWLAAVSVFRPLERLSAQALSMSGTNLSERLVTTDRAEFGTFARDLNRLLDRVEETVRRGERFSTDAAHELRTPLAILRTRLETALLQTRSPEQYEATLHRSVDEIGRLTAITEALLRSARGETAPAAPLDLAPLAQEAQARWEERFANKEVDLIVSADATLATLLPDEARVVLDNLLDNALRYAPAGSQVLLSIESVDGEAQLLVQDAGPGVPAELGYRIFDRFVRADDSRNRESGGAGVGLSVCQQIIANRGGQMILVQDPSGGAAVGFRL